MRYSKYFLFTLKENPSDAEVISHRLMLRAGMIKKVAAGIYNYLPLGLRAIRKVEKIIREEHDREGCIELLMPSIQPAELWQESGRWSVYGPELLRIRDRKQGDFCYGPTHEELITDIVRREVKSYRQLPLTLYQIQTKFRDEIRPRFGLMRGREFIMKDAYSFDVDEESCNKSYWKMFEVYKNIFKRCGLDFRPVEADSGAIGGSYSHEFHVLAQSGEDLILSCSNCDYTANMEQAECAPPSKACQTEQTLKMEFVETPNQKTIQEISCFLKAKPENIVKSLIYKAKDEFVMICIRGDREANPVKIRRVLGIEHIPELASEYEIERVTNAPMGFSGPLGIKGIKIIADIELMYLKNFIVGANKNNMHIINANWNDVDVFAWKDLRISQPGETCPRCKKGIYRHFQGIEVGQVFKLGKKYSKSMKCVFLDAQGKEKEMVMGCYGIGVGRTVAACIEQNHDENGIVWPWPIAPFQINLILLDSDNQKTVEASDKVYEILSNAGYEVLYDDRSERPGVKFADADLLGFPIRITIGARSLSRGGVEITTRRLGRDGNKIIELHNILQGVEKVSSNFYL